MSKPLQGRARSHPSNRADEHADETFDELNARWYREDRNIVALVAAARKAAIRWTLHLAEDHDINICKCDDCACARELRDKLKLFVGGSL